MFLIYDGFISDVNGSHSIHGSKTPFGNNITKEFLAWEKIWMPRYLEWKVKSKLTL